MKNLIQEAIYKNKGLMDDTKLCYYWATEQGKYMVALADYGKTEYYMLRFNDRRKKGLIAGNLRENNNFNVFVGDYIIMLKPEDETASITIDCGDDKEMAIGFVKSLREQYLEQKYIQSRREKLNANKQNNQTKSL